ncbi:MAG: phospholipase [Desulfobulbaceae bacterium]|uniref:phospholipase D n=1 Tax=Candidatus Desulfatifera sulfidica TaxID=2841691 RepID=A0A8J6NAM6_9BACT|nr:phospholipase [Candidatus Desulfatifera sulfidica]
MIMPIGLSIATDPVHVDEVEFFVDLTYTRDGQLVHEQAVNEQILRLIDQAECFVVIDMFLLGDEYDRRLQFPPLSDRFVETLVSKKKSCPDVDLVLITDEVNTHYGSSTSPHLERLQNVGVEVVLTDLRSLPDSNLFYSPLWRLFGRLFGWQVGPGSGCAGRGWLPSPFSPQGPKMTLVSYLRLLNFKANHRKVVVSEKSLLVTSANIHDASAYHSNIAFLVHGALVSEAVAAEQAVAQLSGHELPSWPRHRLAPSVSSGNIRVRLLTEGKIKKHLLQGLALCGLDDSVTMAMFYLSDQELVMALQDAATRGARIRLILDPNKDAFGRTKKGIPNRPMARQLLGRSKGDLAVRWYKTSGEQFHTKLTMISYSDRALIIGGSANLTRRNIADFNLEACLEIDALHDAPVVKEVEAYLERIWSNRDAEYTTAYETYPGNSFVQYLWYRFQEWNGLGTF